MDASIASWSGKPFVYAFAGLIAYASVCRILRFHRIRSVQRKYGFGMPARPDFSSMTNDEAFEIMKEVSEAEFPTLFEKGLQLALFRTYGIPSISKLLVQTAQLSTSENVAKRYADTALIITEIYSNPPTHERAIESFARLNVIHGHYLAQSRITNDDMLYTLALFMNHPCEWINRYEWRQLTDIEVCAIATFHKSMGEAMQISFDPLPGSKSGWKDGLDFYHDLDTWAKSYEEKNLKPHADNLTIALRTQDLLLSTVPRFTHGIVSQFIAAAMDDPLRLAVQFPAAPRSTHSTLSFIMTTRRLFLRHLCLPRWQRTRHLSTTTSADGRRWIEIWSTTPHYVRPTFWKRWGPTGLYQLSIGAPRPGDAGMVPEGYLRHELGPRAFKGKGMDVFEQEKERLGRERVGGGCPFVGVRP